MVAFAIYDLRTHLLVKFVLDLLILQTLPGACQACSKYKNLLMQVLILTHTLIL